MTTVTSLTRETVTDMAVIFRDLEAAEKLLADVRLAITQLEQGDIRDVFGRRTTSLELGVPSGDNSRRILQVPYPMAIPMIEATIAAHHARLKMLESKARAELSSPETATISVKLAGDYPSEPAV